MKQYAVRVSWTQPTEETFLVEAEDEESAAEKAFEENEEIGDDWEVEKITCIGEVAPEPGTEPEDPNQMKFEV